MKKNIVFVNNTLGEGGAEKVLIDILNRLDYEKYNVTLFLLENKGVRFENLNKNVKLKYLYPNIEIKGYISSRVWNILKYRIMKYFYWLVHFICIGMKNDVEIAFIEGEPTRFVSQSLNKRSRKIAWVHTDLEKRRPQEINELYKNIYERFDEIVCVSNSSKRAFNNIYKDLNKNVQVIYNLIEIDEIKNLSNEPIKFNFNKPTIVSVGRLTKIKRMDLIIRAHKNIIDKGIEHDLIILGIGEEYDNLVSLTEKLNVKESVHFLGYKKNPYPYIKKADLFVMGSEFEGLPLVIAESIVLGKAIVSTDNGGATELLGDMLYSELVDVNDLNALTKAIYEVLINTKIKCDLELKSKERAKVFDNVNVMQSIHNIIG